MRSYKQKVKKHIEQNFHSVAWVMSQGMGLGGACGSKTLAWGFGMAPHRLRILVWQLFFLFLTQNICCGYSKEPSQWDGSFDHPKHIFNSPVIGLSLSFRPSVHFFFKWHLLNHLSKFHIASHECSPWCPLSKLHKWFHSTQQKDCQSFRKEIF